MSVKTEIHADTQQAQVNIKKFTDALEKLNKQGEQSSKALNQISKNTNKLWDNLAHTGQAITGWASIVKSSFDGVVGNFIKTADAINTMNARLKLTTTSTAHFEALKNSINEIARATSSSTESISNLFINLNQSLSEMGLSQKQALEMAQTLSQALKVGGASAIDAERAITQFSQALSTGKLQGQDFKAMIQAAPSLLKNMADALGVTTGELRGMATAGELTNEKLVAAFAGMKDKIAKEFKEIPPTVENAMTNLQTSINGVIESINNDLNITGSVAASIDGIGKIISENSGAFKTATEFIKNHGVELVALLAIYKSTPAVMATAKSSIAALSASFGSASAAASTFTSVANGLISTFKRFLPTLVIFGTFELLYNWLNKDAAAADKLTNALALTKAQMDAMGKASVKHNINETTDAIMSLNKQIRELENEVSIGKEISWYGVNPFGLDSKEIDAKKAQIEELKKQQNALKDTLSQLFDRQKELNSEQNSSTNILANTAKAVDTTTQSFKNLIATSSEFTKNITTAQDYKDKLKAVNSEIDKWNALLKTGNLDSQKTAAAQREILKLQQASADIQSKIAKENGASTKAIASGAKAIKDSYEQALKAQENYYKSINDYASANAKALQSYEIELSEQIKKQLITREQAEKLYQKKRVELENDTNEKILNDRLKTLQEEAEFFKITGQREKELESYYKIADEQAKAFIKKWEVTDKNFIKNINNYFKSENSKSFKSMNESFNENISSMTNAWDNAVDSMAKSISDGLFDLITGKTESLSDAFSKIGKNILGAFVSPLAQSFSDGVGNIFKGLMGGGGSALSAFADDYGLKLENGVYRGEIGGNLVEILTDGSVKTGGSILSSVLGLSESTDNVLSAVSSLKSGVSILTNGITGLQSSILSTTYSPFGFASGLLNDFGATGLGSFVNDFGVGFSNITSFNGFGSGGLGAIFEGTIGQALGAAAGGASVGGLVGSLGDMLFGTKTQASTGGAIGGAIGTAILPGIGTAIGGLLGSIAGSFFGEWETTDTGVEIKQFTNYSAGQSLNAFGAGKYEDMEKNGWFSSKEKSEYSPNASISGGLNRTMKKLNTLIEDFRTNDLILPAIKITEDFKNGTNMIIATSLVSAIQEQGWLTQAATDNVFAWEAAAKAQGKEVLGFMTEQISTMRTYMKALKIDTKDAFANLGESVKEYEKSFSTLAKDMGLGWLADINVAFVDGTALADMYSAAIKNSFDPDTVENWNALIESYNLAKQAQMAYTQALRELQATANNAVLSIKSAFGENVDILSIDALQAQVNALNRDLELPRKSLAELADYLKNMDFTDMSVFLREDTAQKQELINYTLQYAQMGNNALTNLKNAFAQYADTINNLNSQIQNIKENLSKTINDGIKALNNDIANFQKQIEDGYKNIENLQKNLVTLQNQLNALDLKENIDNQKELLNLRAEEISSQLALLKSSKNFAEGLKAIATNLRTSIYSAEQNALFYKQTLQQAKSDYLSGNFDSASLTNLSAAASAYAANLKDKSSSAEQYRFEVLQMANEIEGIAPQSEIARIEASIKALEAQLSNINITLDGLNDLLNNDDSYEAQRASLLEQIEQTKQNIENQKIQIETLEASKLLAEQQVEHLLKVLEDFGFSLEIEQGTYENVIEQTEQGKRQIKLLENEIQNTTYLFDTLMSDNHALFSNLGGQFYSGFLDLRSTFDSGCAYIASSVSSAVTSSVSAATAAASAAASAAAAANNTASSGAALSKPRAFADGGIVTGATNALIGEAGYPEAVIPLKDGAGLKVDMDGGFNSLEKRLAKLEMVLNKIAATNDETARTLRNVSDGEVLYIKGA